MTPEEVEVLIRRIPELQPSRALEDRVVRLRSKRRFPAATAIAASALFAVGVFWLAASARRKEDRPIAAPVQDEAIHLRIEHQAECAPYLQGSLCGDPQHWKQTPGALERKEEGWSDRKVVVHGSPVAPWGAIQRILEAAAKAGFYKIEWVPGGETRKIWLPKDRGVAPLGIVLEDIRIRLFRDAGLSDTVRKVGQRREVTSDEELMRTVLQMVQDYKKAGKTEWPIIVDAAPNVPWKDVIHVVDLCTKEDLNAIEFGTPERRVKELVAPPKRETEDESMFAQVQKDLAAGQSDQAVKRLEEMITRFPNSSSTVRALTQVAARVDEYGEIVKNYRKKWLVLAPAVYDALLKPRNLIERHGVLDPAALSKAPESLGIYLELGYVYRELGKSGQKFQFDNASTVFSNVARVVASGSEPWWTARYEVLATLVERGEVNDLKLATVGLTNIERTNPTFDDNKYGMKDRFLKLKQRIAASK